MHMIGITPLPARPMRTSPLVASCRAWVAAGLVGGPSSRAALSSGDAERLSSGSCLYTGAFKFLGDGRCAHYHTVALGAV